MPTTANFSWSTPVVGGSSGTWGTILNTLFDAIDTDLQAVSDVADAALPLAGGTMTGNIAILTEDYTINALGNITGNPFDVDWADANYQYGTLTGNATLTFSNPPTTGRVGTLILEITNGAAFTLTWPGTVVWDGAVAPTLKASGVDTVAFTTRDGGTTYRGYSAGSFNS